MERKIALYTLEDYDGIEFSATTKTDMVKYLKREGYSPGTTRVFTYMKGHRKGSLKLNAFLKLRWAKESNEVIDEKLIYKKHQDDIDAFRKKLAETNSMGSHADPVITAKDEILDKKYEWV